MITFNSFLLAYLVLYLITSITDIIIDHINVIHLKRYGMTTPDGFQGMVDGDKLKKINEYSIDNSRLNLVRTIAGKLTFLFIILSGLLPWFSWSLRDYNFILAGLLFFAVPGLAGAIIDLPFDYFHIFQIEEKYGFNTRTFKIWISDLFKSLLITGILGAVLLSLLFLMVRFTGNMWWIWAWLIFFIFQLLMSFLYPTVIAPIFNKFTPVEDDELAKSIMDLSEREGLTIKGIFQMDAGRRSRHTNAYFSGLGKSKRIVLYDTLLESNKKDEILAVLAHEIGHLKKGHIRKQLIAIGLVSFILFFLASKVIGWELLYRSFGFSHTQSYVGLFLTAVLWEPAGFFLSPLGMAVARKFERDADSHAKKAMKSGEPLIRALKKIVLDNLSNLNPHPLYVWFNYSHPPILERIEGLKHT